MSTHSQQLVWIRRSITWGASFFIFALVVSAVFDPGIRVLHALQVLIYVATLLLVRRDSAWGYGAGFFSAALWNYTNLFITNFIVAGLSQLWALVTTGHVARPDLIVAVAAGVGHAAMIVGCAAGFLRSRPARNRWAAFVGGGVIAVAYFVVIIYTTGTQYSPLIRRVFHVGG